MVPCILHTWAQRAKALLTFMRQFCKYRIMRPLIEFQKSIVTKSIWSINPLKDKFQIFYLAPPVFTSRAAARPCTGVGWRCSFFSRRLSLQVQLNASHALRDIRLPGDIFETFRYIFFNFSTFFSIVRFQICQAFFLTSAAEKTKTQGQNSSQKLKEKTQPLGGTPLKIEKLKKN